VTCVYEGLSGLRQIQSGEWDLALIDIKMPGMDGMSLLKEA
jgi:CheY-like chemotaxis protein